MLLASPAPTHPQPLSTSTPSSQRSSVSIARESSIRSVSPFPPSARLTGHRRPGSSARSSHAYIGFYQDSHSSRRTYDRKGTPERIYRHYKLALPTRREDAEACLSPPHHSPHLTRPHSTRALPRRLFHATSDTLYPPSRVYTSRAPADIPPYQRPTQQCGLRVRSYPSPRSICVNPSSTRSMCSEPLSGREPSAPTQALLQMHPFPYAYAPRPTQHQRQHQPGLIAAFAASTRPRSTHMHAALFQTR